MSNSDAGSYVLKAIKTEVLDRGYDTVSNSFMSTSGIAPCGKNNDDEPAVPSSSGPFPRDVKAEVKSYECDVPPPKISGTDADESISSPLPNPSNSLAFVPATNKMDDFAHHAAARSNNISADGESVSKMSICPGANVHAPAVYTEKEHEELQRNAAQSPGRYFDAHDNTHDKPGYPDKESSPTAKSEVLTDDGEESEDSETLITDNASRSVETHTAHDSHVQGTSTFRRERETKTPGLKGTQLSVRRAKAGRNATQLDSSLPDNGQHWFIQQNAGETSSLPDKLYLCTICSLGFARHKDLKEHSYNHKKKYRRYAELLNQIKSKSSITEKDMFQCTHCSTSFTFASDLTKHLKSHEEDRFLASRLEQRRKTKQHRKKKVSTFRENPAPESDKASRRSSDVTHTCSVCGSVFSSVIALQEHMHHPERPVLETGEKLEMETNIKCMSARADQKQRGLKTSLTNDLKKDKNSGKDNRRAGGEEVQKRMNETKQLEGREMPLRTSGELQSEFRTSGELQSEFRTRGELQSEFRTSGELQSEFRTSGELQNEFRTRGELQNEFRTRGELQNEFRTSGELQSEFRTSGELQSEFRTSGELQSEFRTRGELQRMNFVQVVSCRVNFVQVVSCRVNFVHVVSCRVNFVQVVSCRMNFVQVVSCRVNQPMSSLSTGTKTTLRPLNVKSRPRLISPIAGLKDKSKAPKTRP